MMNRWLAGFAVILTGICAVQAQTNKRTSAEAALIDLENRWVAALVKADTAALDAIFAATYVDTDEGGSRADKAALLAVLKSRQLKMTSIKLSDMHVYLYGNSTTAIEPSHSSLSSARGGAGGAVSISSIPRTLGKLTAPTKNCSMTSP